MTEIALVESSTLCHDYTTLSDIVDNYSSVPPMSSMSAPIYDHHIELSEWIHPVHNMKQTTHHHIHEQHPFPLDSVQPNIMTMQQHQQEILQVTRHTDNLYEYSKHQSHHHHHPRVRFLREHTRQFVPNEPYHKTHRRHHPQRTACIKIVSSTHNIRSTSSKSPDIPQTNTRRNDIVSAAPSATTDITIPPSSLCIMTSASNTAPTPLSTSTHTQKTTTDHTQMRTNYHHLYHHQQAIISPVQTPRTFTYQCSAHRGREQPQSALLNGSIMRPPISTHQNHTVRSHQVRVSDPTVPDSSVATTPTIPSVRPKAVIFHGECFLCSGRHHSQNFCPLRQCSICHEYGHSHKVCTSTNQISPSTASTIPTNKSYHSRVRTR